MPKKARGTSWSPPADIEAEIYAALDREARSLRNWLTLAARLKLDMDRPRTMAGRKGRAA